MMAFGKHLHSCARKNAGQQMRDVGHPWIAPPSDREVHGNVDGSEHVAIERWRGASYGRNYSSDGGRFISAMKSRPKSLSAVRAL